MHLEKKNQKKKNKKQNKTKQNKQTNKQREREREGKRTVGPVVHTKKERSEGTGHGVDVYGAHRSAQSSSGEGQRTAAAVRGRGG